MAEMRQDLTTGDWVAFAPERASRPYEAAPGSPPSADSGAHWRAECPFCPGNEASTPPALNHWRLEGQQPGEWAVRVVPNRFPIFSANGGGPAGEVAAPFLHRPANGAHEVVIDTPDHAKPLRSFSDEEMALLFLAYQVRYDALRAQPGVQAAFPFRNHAAAAGASLTHPHSQIVATPVLPPLYRRRLEVARAYRTEHGRCRYCDLRNAERSAGDRVLFETDGCVAFVPYAARSPYETWIVPLRHGASFGAADGDLVMDVALATRRVLSALHAAAGDVPYNYVIQSALFEHGAAMLWHVEIVPRLTEAAGFELGSGMAVNPVLPEQAASALRSHLEGDSQKAKPNDEA